MPTDSELLRQHVEDGSEAAFTELVRRYAGLVYSAALRSVCGKAHLAEDVAQDVFILLARKAPMLIGHETLAGWLHLTTRNVALSMVRNLWRRESREKEAVTMHTNSARDIHWEQLRPLLDEAVEQLDDRDRNAVLLRYFQGQSHREVGAALGLSEDSARVRTDRAVEKLRRYFARSGVVTTAALLTELLATNAAQAAPVGFVDKAAAVAHAKGLSLGHIFLKTIYMTTKTKIAIVTAALVAVIAAVPMQIQSRANIRLQGELGAAQKQVITLKAGQHKLETQLASQSQELQVLQAGRQMQAGQSSLSATATPARSKVNPHAPSPGVYPATPGVMAAEAAARANGTQLSAADRIRIQYGNFFQKLQFTPEQTDAFVQIKVDEQGAVRAAQQQFEPSETNPLPGGLTNAQIQAEMANRLAQEQPGMDAAHQTADAQVQQMLGADNYAYYQEYNTQANERSMVMNGLTDQMAAAGAPPLTLDQVETIVSLTHQNLVNSGGNRTVAAQGLPQVLQQASVSLAPAQTDVLQQDFQQLPASWTVTPPAAGQTMHFGANGGGIIGNASNAPSAGTGGNTANVLNGALSGGSGTLLPGN